MMSKRLIIFLLGCATIAMSLSKSACAQGTLRFHDGDAYQGEFSEEPLKPNDTKTNTPAANAKHLLWKCNAFLEPMLVPWDVIDSISFARDSARSTSPETSPPNGPALYVVEFENGDSITGQLEQTDRGTLVLKSDRFETAEWKWDQVRAILKVHHASHEGGRLYPNEWKQILPVPRDDLPPSWTAKVGSIETVIAGTTISQVSMLPSLAAIDIDVAWTHSNPNWTLTVGNSFPKLELRVRKLEQRDDLSVSLLFEEEASADIATVLIPSQNLESIRLKLLCDWENGQFRLEQNGRAIGEISASFKPDSNATRQAGPVRFQITNDASGGMILRELNVTRSMFSLSRLSWIETGIENREAKTEGSSGSDRAAKILFSDGRMSLGVLKFEGEQGSIWSETDGGRTPFVLSDVDRIEFDSKQLPEKRESCLVLTLGGERFLGSSMEQMGDSLMLMSSTLPSPIRFLLPDIASVQFTSTTKVASRDDGKPIPMRLVSDAVYSNGFLVPKEEEDTDSEGAGWAWRPLSLDREMILNPMMTGTLDMVRPGLDSQAFEGERRNLSLRTDTYGRSLDQGEPAFFLLNGDSLPGALERLEDGMVTFNSELFGRAQLAASELKGVRQLVYTGTDRVDPIVLNRLLTVPRMSRQSPPTHLVVSRDGDIIRGNVIYIDEDLIRISVRDEEREIWMKNVAEVIWLDPAPPLQGSEDSPPDSAEDSPPSGLDSMETSSPACQLILRRGSTVSVIPRRIEQGILFGVHPLLGECRIPIDDVVRILFGQEIEQARSVSRFAKWKLRHAVDPKFVSEEANAATGEDAELVGKPAPDFTLRKLDGSAIKLSSMKGRVVVLDFWASWCGPCRKSMPVIQGIAKDFEADPFDFFAINVDEEANVVRGTSIVLGITEQCLLDPRAEISKAYGASAIPYTVVIDKEGIVRRVFVGANDAAYIQLREAISQYLELGSP
ncbi:TlpA family protein disulfide reductase [Pirellulaceae bacterium SH449]